MNTINMEDHIKNEHSVKCILCGFTFKSESRLQNHYKYNIKKKNEKQNIVSKSCNENQVGKYSDINNKEDSLKIYETKTFKCEECSYTSPYRGKFNHHVNSTH